MEGMSIYNAEINYSRKRFLKNIYRHLSYRQDFSCKMLNAAKHLNIHPLRMYRCFTA